MSKTIAWVGAAGLMALLCGAAQGAECHFDKTLSVNGSVRLEVGTGAGDIKVQPGNDNEVHVTGKVKADHGWFGDGGNGDERVQKVCNAPPIEQNGSDVRIGKNHEEMYKHVSIDYVIWAPRTAELNTSSGSGDVEVEGMTGMLTAGSGSGNIKADGAGAGSKFETGSGDVTVKNLGGDAKAETGSGNIHVETGSHGDLKVETGSGDITVEGMQGGLRAQTGSGNITINGTPTAMWKLSTGSGDVRMTIPESVGYTLDAETSSGDIQVSQPITMQGSMSKQHVHGTVHGGGPDIHAETGSGNIELK